jgi:SAM-dependent methyltransferase
MKSGSQAAFDMNDWNARYKRGEHTNDEPVPFVLQFASRLRPGRALDVACGPGRHALWLAEHGWQVTAVDSSNVAIEMLQQRAAEKKLTVDARIADLERHEFIIEPRSYDLIVVCNYLQRDLFPQIKEGTRTGGLVLAVIAMVDQDPNIKPMNPAYLLKPGELRKEFEEWERIWYFEGKPGDGPRRAIAEIAARHRSS